MSELTKQENAQKILPEAWEKLLIQGELQQLSSEQRAKYYLKVCDSLGLNHLTRPFDYISFQGKLTLYARKDCTDQLRKNHCVSIRIMSREKMDDLYVVTAIATQLTSGRTDESIGALSIAGLKGADLANALMKCETKAKRRATLSICGLGILDESEIGDRQHQIAAPAEKPDYLPGIKPNCTAAQYIENLKEVPGAASIVACQIKIYEEARDAVHAMQLLDAMNLVGLKQPAEEPESFPEAELLPFEKK